MTTRKVYVCDYCGEEYKRDFRLRLVVREYDIVNKRPVDRDLVREFCSASCLSSYVHKHGAKLCKYDIRKGEIGVMTFKTGGD